jgi:hypothetical protein
MRLDVPPAAPSSIRSPARGTRRAGRRITSPQVSRLQPLRTLRALRREIAPMIPVAPDSSRRRPRLRLFTRIAHREAAHTVRERRLVVRLHDDVDVVLMHGVVRDAKAIATRVQDRASSTAHACAKPSRACDPATREGSFACRSRARRLAIPTQQPHQHHDRWTEKQRADQRDDHELRGADVQHALSSRRPRPACRSSSPCRRRARRLRCCPSSGRSRRRATRTYGSRARPEP